jgi:hypothetical protein
VLKSVYGFTKMITDRTIRHKSITPDYATRNLRCHKTLGGPA